MRVGGDDGRGWWRKWWLVRVAMMMVVGVSI